jgi:ferredoxin--NADP+ reductase
MRYRVVDSQRLAPTLTRLVVEAPLVARKRRAGQFVIVRLGPSGERIPLTIVDSGGDTITLIVQSVGRTTRLLAALRPGDALCDIVGPLGNPTPLESRGDVACVAGGVGVAVMLPIATALQEAGARVHSILGARTRDLVILESELAAVSATLAISTDDGTRGRAGRASALLSELLSAQPLTVVYATGPLPMMRAVAELTRPAGVRTCVSLNPVMVDGTGMCGGCRVMAGGVMKFACVDGPEFDAHLVDFDELERRNRTYARLERLADARCPVGA